MCTGPRWPIQLESNHRVGDMQTDLDTATLRDVILNPSAFSKAPVKVEGTVVLLDRSIDRMDISSNGAKLIVQLAHVEDTGALDSLTESSVVAVAGTVRKQQRRTFMDAVSVEMRYTDMSHS